MLHAARFRYGISKHEIYYYCKQGEAEFFGTVSVIHHPDRIRKSGNGRHQKDSILDGRAQELHGLPCKYREKDSHTDLDEPDPEKRPLGYQGSCGVDKEQ